MSRRYILAFILCIGAAWSSVAAESQTFVCIDKVTGLVGTDSIIAGDTIRFRFAYVNHSPYYFSVANMFRFYSRATVDTGDIGSGTAKWPSTATNNRRPYITFAPDFVNTGPQVDTTGGFGLNDFPDYYKWRAIGCDGEGADTIQFSGFTPGGEGLKSGDSITAFTAVLITRKEDSGKVICVDTAQRWVTSDRWRWVSYSPGIEIDPDWTGPYCFTLAAQNPDNCCHGQAGNLDCSASGLTDISDLVTLIDYLYITFKPVCCLKAANIDGDPGGGVDIADLSALIDYMYISFAPPANCL